MLDELLDPLLQLELDSLLAELVAELLELDSLLALEALLVRELEDELLDKLLELDELPELLDELLAELDELTLLLETLEALELLDRSSISRTCNRSPLLGPGNTKFPVTNNRSSGRDSSPVLLVSTNLACQQVLSARFTVTLSTAPTSAS